MSSLDYDVARLDFTADGDGDRKSGFVRAVSRAFLDPHPTDEAVAKYVGRLAADRARATGAWLPGGAFGAGPVPVATFVSFDGTLNTGASLLPVWMITDVTVSPSHRRRGLLSRLLTSDLEHARSAGVPVAALTASEGGIYGRFGFAPATSMDTVEVDLGPGFALRLETSDIRVELVAAEHLGSIPEDDFGVLHGQLRGSISRPAFYGLWVRGELDPETGEEDRRVHCAVALDSDEQPVGHVTWKTIGNKAGRSTITVLDLVGRTVSAHLALWRFVAGIDLVEVAQATMSATDPLRWALVNPRMIKVTGREDLLWLRILDVPAALAARPWRGDGEVVLRTLDPTGLAGGTWTVRVHAGRASITEGGRADLELGIDSLAALYLGGVDACTLSAAGRITGATEDVERLAALLGDSAPPATRTNF